MLLLLLKTTVELVFKIFFSPKFRVKLSPLSEGLEILVKMWMMSLSILNSRMKI